MVAFKKYRIGEICTVVKGTYPTLKTEPGEYPLVVTASYRRSANTYQLEGPAVCVPLISSTGHGRATMHRVHYQEGKFALANLLIALLPKDHNVCNAQYLYHLLMAKKDAYFVPLMTGTANVSLKEADIAGVEIPLPSLDEQRSIVARLDELTVKIEEARGLYKGVQEDLRKVLLSAYAEIIQEAKPMPMKEVAPLARRPIEVEPEKDYYELGIRSFGKGTFHKPSIGGAALGTKRIFQIKPGDLLFNIVFAWEGAVAVARSEDEGRVGSHRFLTCVPKDKLATSAFLFFHFLTEQGLQQLGEASPGGAGRNRTLGLKALEEIVVPIPSLEKQIWFDSLQAKADMIKRLQAKTAAELEALLPAVLDQAFRGEL
jgi:type I restriction enzyme S subunit